MLMQKLMNEMAGEEGYDGAGGADVQMPSGESEAAEAESLWLRDIDEDTAYNTLQNARQFPDHMRGLESRLFGRLGPLQEKLNSLEKSLGSRVSLDAEKIRKALDAYDGSGALSEVLVPALTEAFQVNPLDENSIRPFVEPLQQSMQQQMAENLVLSHFSPEQIADIIPEVADGKWSPQSQRHKDFIDWYSQQGYDMQQSLNEFGPKYIHALRSFERWEKDRNQEREKAVGAKSNRLAGGQQPSSQGRRPRTAGPQTAEEAFLAGYNEVD
jgi:hypothetical protein